MSERIVILGAGESGTGAAVLAKVKGMDVFVSDLGMIKPKYRELLTKYNIAFEENRHTDEYILSADRLIRSPGISDKTTVMVKVKEKKIPVISEIEFAFPYSDAMNIVITGSNGKTTTTMLIHHILKKAGLNAGLAGNVGKSFALQVAENRFEYYVIELSSFQLDDMYRFRADIAILMNISPDHLDRYHYNFQEYIDSKFRVVQNMTGNDSFIYCQDDPVIREELKKRNIEAQMLPFSLTEKNSRGAYIEQEELIINFNNNRLSMILQELALQGKHNTYNSMAAGIAGMVLKIRKGYIRESLSDFQGVEHRMEPVIKVHGIEFVNDSKATNVNSTWYALESMKNKVVLIIGGVDKGNDYSMLTDLVKQKVKALICLGKDNTKLIKSFKDCVENISETTSMKEAVRMAYYLAKNGDTVLLSPACASFDLFENYEDRGRQFKQAVREL